MPQFSLQRLFVSLTLIAAGCGVFVWLHQWKLGVVIPLGFVLCGVGIGTLFKNPVLGGVLGFLLWLPIVLLLVPQVN
jgi:hypothetical protein